jgi:probable HAF family extracellular repeat protein
MRRRMIQLLSLLCVGLGLSISAPIDAAQYLLTPLDPLPVPAGEDSFGHDGYAYAINNGGVVVGESTIDRSGAIGRSRPVMWSESSQAQELWSDQNFGGKGLGVNSSGFVVGRYGSSDVTPLPGPGIPDGGAFIWNPTTRQFMDLGDLGGSRVEATGINDAGQAAGSSEALEVATGSDGQPTFEIQDRAFIWDAVNGMHDLGTLGGNFSRGTAINDLGQVVGWSTNNGLEQAFIWDSMGGMRALGTNNESRAYSVNDHGQVVGIEFGVGGFLWDEASGVRSIGNIFPTDINNFGQVVGQNGMIWDSENGLRHLEDLISPAPGWEIVDVASINDRGQIVGTGHDLADGSYRGFLLTPVPEPSTAMVTGIALFFGGWLVHHRNGKCGRRQRQEH